MNYIEALKIAIEAKLKKQSILAKPQSNEGSPQKTTKLDLASPSKGRKMLPPITNHSSSPNIQKDATMAINLTSIRPTEDSLAITANRSKESYTLTTKSDKKSDKKKPHQFFITNEFLDSSHINQTLSLTNREDPSL